MVNVTDSTDITMWFCSFNFSFCHFFKDAMKKAAPVLLEPIMKVEVTMPEEYMGDVIGDIMRPEEHQR